MFLQTQVLSYVFVSVFGLCTSGPWFLRCFCIANAWHQHHPRITGWADQIWRSCYFVEQNSLLKKKKKKFFKEHLCFFETLFLMAAAGFEFLSNTNKMRPDNCNRFCFVIAVPRLKAEQALILQGYHEDQVQREGVAISLRTKVLRSSIY